MYSEVALGDFHRERLVIQVRYMDLRLETILEINIRVKDIPI